MVAVFQLRHAAFGCALFLAVSCGGTVTLDDETSPDAEDSDTPDSDSRTLDSDADPDSDASPGDTLPGDTAPLDTGTPAPAPADLRQRGPLQITTTPSAWPAGSGCVINYDRVRPSGPPPTGPVVVLSHGFQRRRDQVRGWARHFASWGLDVVVPDLCHSTILDADHPRNADELRRMMADRFPQRPLVWAGHSAGGLSAALAAADDPSALGVLLFDPVDTGGLGIAAAPDITAPVATLLAEPSPLCNGNGNGLALTRAAPTQRALRITDATHCDFENPTDAVCRLSCGIQFGQVVPDNVQQAAILALATGFLRDVTGIAPGDTARWWERGNAEHDSVRASGALIDP